MGTAAASGRFSGESSLRVALAALVALMLRASPYDHDDSVHGAAGVSTRGSNSRAMRCTGHRPLLD